MNSSRNQRGATLVVSVIMLMVVTVLVVYSLRSGNINLRIAGNMQRQGEAMMASQQVIEQVIEDIKTIDNIALIAGKSETINNAGAAYTVITNNMGAAGSCILAETVPASELIDPGTSQPYADAMPCFDESGQGNPIFGPNGKPLPGSPTGCKNQTWEISASVSEVTSGTQHTQVQGIRIRVPAVSACP